MLRILVLNFFPAFTPPGSGGELRYFNFYKSLSRFFDITLLSPTYSDHKEEVIRHSDTYREYRVPKERIHNILHQEIDKEQICPEISGLVCALSGLYPNNYHRAYLRLVTAADIIIHDSPYMVDYDLLAGVDNKPRVYNSHNVESKMAAGMWSGLHAAKYLAFIQDAEGRLVKDCDLCFATSSGEKSQFSQLFQVDKSKIALAPNGINPEDYPENRPPDHTVRALFLGSFHPPNLEATSFIIHQLAGRCPDIEFVIAGNCVSETDRVDRPNLRILGKISDQTRRELFQTSTIALNPMFSGAGTNLKVLEYLSSGLPLIATTHGGRGLNLIPDQHFIEAGRDTFASQLNALAADPLKRAVLSQNGKSFVNANFSWEAIASNVADRIHKMVASRAARKTKTIVVFNDFSAAKPSAGGEIRIHHLYRNLGAYHQVVLLCLNNGLFIERRRISRGFTEISWPKTSQHREEQSRVNAQFWVSADDAVASYMVTQNRLFVEVAHALCRLADVVILCHPYLEKLTDGVEVKHLIYESLNWEFGLKSETLKGHPDQSRLVAIVRDCEAKAVEKSTCLISVSDSDHAGLLRFTPTPKPIHTIKNGVVIPAEPFPKESLAGIRQMFGGRPVILFIGSGHKPNTDSMNWINRHLAPTMPDCFFLVVGSVCGALAKDTMSANVLPCGQADEATKETLFGLADVAINPMIAGSGSNLKLGDYFANRVPVVTTPFGARGYEIRHSREAMICELSGFAESIRQLVRDLPLSKRLAENAFQYTRDNLCWKVLARRFDQVLHQEIFNRGKKRLLVVTYRFTDPPRGGGEAHLLELLRHIDRSGEYSIEVATLDILDIHDQYYFSPRYTRDQNAGLPRDLANTRVHRFKADSLPAELRLNHCRVLFDHWMQESRERSLKYLDKYEFPLLLGGWYHPERTQKGFEIWSSGEALIFVRGASALSLEGLCPNEVTLTCLADGAALAEKKVQGRFHIELPLNQSSVLSLSVDRLLEPGDDPRRLGMRVLSIRVTSSNQESSLRLDYDYKDFLKARHLESYIEDLIRTAESRPAVLDEMFQAVRGPLSAELESWLEENAQHYDLIMANSVPFSTSIIGAAAGKRHGIPVALIPLFHVEDEFYHWKSYYDALRQCDVAITFPKAASQLFFDKIGCRSQYLPHGAPLDESPSTVDEKAFAQLSHSSLPYVLVLGRKSNAKNYRHVIDALREVNKIQKLCDVVIIGRDEDGVPIDPAEACYLGEQPRGVVLTALKHCLCLATMSESESFGIVILEAWAQGRPVIVNSGSVAYTELVDDGQNGLLATQEDLALKVSFFLNHPEEARRMGTAGFHKAESVFSWSAISTSLLSLFRGLIKAYAEKSERKPARPCSSATSKISPICEERQPPLKARR